MSTQPPLEEEVVDELQERYKEFKSSLVALGLGLSFVTGCLLCSFLIPGLSQRTRISLWQCAALVLVGMVVSMGMHVKEFGWSFAPKVKKPAETLTGADLC